MTKLRVLVLGSYPAVNPRHGGQIRLAQIVAAYRACRLEVKQASFFPANPFYMEGALSPADTGLPATSLRGWRGHQAPLIEDLASGDAVAADAAKLASLEKYAGPTDIVHLEQPWLLPVVEQLRTRGALGAFRLVYGSQNIEHPLKEAIFRQYGVRGGESLIDAIRQLEQRAAGAADLVAAVTEEDVRQLRQWTAAPVVLAPNGIAPWKSDAYARQRWEAKLGTAPFALYVASAHPPNVIGLCASFGECLGALSPLQTLVLAGSVTEHIVKSDWFKRWGPLNERRTLAAGVLSDQELSALRDMAHTFVLPMTSGGGSNLKTAEALYSGKRVVATPLAMRGFELFADLPGVAVAEPGRVFAKAVSQSLAQGVPLGSEQDSARRERLTWRHTLADLCAAAVRLGEVAA